VKASYDYYGQSVYEALGVEATANYFSTTSTSGSTTANGYIFRTDAIYPLLPNEKIVPFLAFGIGDMVVQRGAASENSPLVNAGFGIKYLWENYLAVRSDFRYLATYRKDQNSRGNYELTVGLAYLFGKEHKTKKPASAETAPPIPKAIPDIEETPEAPPVEQEQGAATWEKLGATGAAVVGITMDTPEFLPAPELIRRGNAQAFKPVQPPFAAAPTPGAQPSGTEAPGPAAKPGSTVAPTAKPGSAVEPAPAARPGSAVKPTPAPAAQPDSAVKPTPASAVEPGSAVEPAPAARPDSAVKPTPAPAVEPGSAVEPAPTSRPDSAVKPTPAPAVKPGSAVKPTAAPAVEQGSAVEPAPTSRPDSAIKPTPTPADRPGSAVPEPVPSRTAVQKPAVQKGMTFEPTPTVKTGSIAAPAPAETAGSSAAPEPSAKQATTVEPVPAGPATAAAEPAILPAAERIPVQEPAPLTQAQIPALPTVSAASGKPQAANRQAEARQAVRRVVIRFEFAMSDLKPLHKKMIAAAASAIKAASDYSVFIEGHTDSIGSYSYNIALSQQRARSVKNELTSLGVKPGKIATRGYGPSKPVATNLKAKGRRKNRRAVVVVTIVTY